MCLFGKAIDARDYWYRQILDTIEASISIVDMDMNMGYLNKSSRETLNIEGEEYKGKACNTIWDVSICSDLEGNCPLVKLRKDGVKLTPVELSGKTGIFILT